MQILQKQQFTDDNLRQVTSQPEASVTHPHPLLAPGVGPKLGSCWAPAATCPPTRCVCVFYVNEFIYYYFIFCLLLLVVLLRILWHCRHFQLAYPTLPACLASPPPRLTTSPAANSITLKINFVCSCRAKKKKREKKSNTQEPKM